MSQIASAVNVLHSMNPPVAHRDLKLENVLLTLDNRCKLCDFGSCSTGIKKLSTPVERSHQEELIAKNTTLAYRSPEMCDLYSVTELTEAVDIWALGCIFFTMINLVHPFQEAGTLGILSGNWRAVLPHGRLDDSFARFEELFDRMFVKVVPARASIDEVMTCLKCITVGMPFPDRPPHKLQAAAEAVAAEQELDRIRHEKQVAAHHHTQGTIPVQLTETVTEVKSNSAAGRRKMLREGGGGGGAPPKTAPSQSTAPAVRDGFTADFAAFSFPSDGSANKAAPAAPAAADPFTSPALPVMGKEFSDFGAGDAFPADGFDGFPSAAPATTSSDGFDGFPSTAPATTSSDGFDGFPAPSPATTSSDGFAAPATTSSDGFDGFPAPAPAATTNDGFGSDPFSTNSSNDPFSTTAATSSSDPFSVNPPSAPAATNDPFAVAPASNASTPAPALNRFTAFGSGRGADFGEFDAKKAPQQKNDLMSQLYSSDKLDLTTNNKNNQQQQQGHHTHSLKQTVDVMSAFGNMRSPHQNMQQSPQGPPNFGGMQGQSQFNMQQGQNQGQFGMPQHGQPQFGMQQGQFNNRSSQSNNNNPFNF
jgi:serine/threonine protein kinase